MSWSPLRVTMSGSPSPLTSIRSYCGWESPRPSEPDSPRATIWVPVVFSSGACPGSSTWAWELAVKWAGLPPTPTLTDVALLERALVRPGTARLAGSRPPVRVGYCTRPLLMTLGKPLPLRSMYSTSLDVEPVDAERDSSDTPAPTAVCAVWLSLAGAWAPAKSLADGTLMFGAPSRELLAEPALTQTFAF